MNMNISPEINCSPVALEGLDPLLTRGHVNLVPKAQPKPAVEPQKSATYYETRTMLELLGQIEKVRELLSETNSRLTRAYARVSQMEQKVEDQERKLALLPHLEEQAKKALELQTKLDDALNDLEKLRQPWWNRFSRRIT